MKQFLPLLLLSINLMAQDYRYTVKSIVMSSQNYELGPNDTISGLMIIDTTLIHGSYGLQIEVKFQAGFNNTGLFTPELHHLPGTYAKWRIVLYNDGNNFGPFYGSPFSVNGNYAFRAVISKTGWNNNSAAIQVNSPVFYVKQISSSVGIQEYELKNTPYTTTYYTLLGQEIADPSGLCIEQRTYSTGYIYRRKLYICR